MKASEITSVKILGGGCSKCNALEAAAKTALEQLGVPLAIEHVKDYGEIAAYGVMSLPALVVNERPLSSGKVLKPKDVLSLIEKA